MDDRISNLIERMTLEEKASLCSGETFWTTKAIERLGIPAIMMTDGPHGIRKQKEDFDHLGISESVPSTCFPPACALASSFDKELIKEVGSALGKECQAEDVNILLGPGLNIKRSPLWGRNFEYYSEDPILTGDMGAAWIDGVQNEGIGTCIKAYAAYNQEFDRMTVDVSVDERALREIYLRGFEQTVRKSDPWTAMSAYNKVNGTFVSEHKYLLTDILRDEWGFEGFVVTDWGVSKQQQQQQQQ